MTSINVNSPAAMNVSPKNNLHSHSDTIQNKLTKEPEVASTTVTLSAEAKKLAEVDSEEPSVFSSFAHGALGLDNPDKTPEDGDMSYAAGQYLKAAVTVGSLLLIVV